jgi:hypothetical protein
MGGNGSGKGIRPNTSKMKRFTHECPSIDSFNPDWVLHVGATIESDASELNILEGRIEFSFLGDASLDQCIHIGEYPCHFGGIRRWFDCPLCCRRSRFLYFVNGAFGCKRCHNLAHKVENEAKVDILIRKRRKILKKRGMSENHKVKPKGMRWSTFERIKREIAALDDEILLSSTG